MKIDNVVRCALVALLTVAAGSSVAAPGNGNCMQAAVKVTPSSNPISVTLVQEWDPYGGDAGTGGWCDWGSKWYYADLKKGVNYVVWVSDLSNSNCFFFVDTDLESTSAPITSPGILYSVDGSSPDYHFWQNRVGYDEGCWNEYDPDTCRYYFCIGYGEVGDTCKLHVEESNIAKYAELGSALNPIAVDASKAGSRAVIQPSDGGNCHFTAQLEKGVSYRFICTPAKAADAPELNFLLDNPEVLYEYLPWPDPVTGADSFRIQPQDDVGISLSVRGDNLANCRLDWSNVQVGSVGFAAETLKVTDTDGIAQLTVRRTSTEANIRLKWTTVAETALPGVDYEPMTGEIVLKAGGPAEVTIPVKLISGSPRADGEKTFAVRLASVYDIGVDEYSPMPAPQVARVTIMPTGADAPVPVLPSPVDESPATRLANGTFEGVLSGPISAIATLTAGNGGQSATLTVDGRQYALVADGADLKGQTVIDNVTFDFFFTAKLPSGTVADLADAPGEPAFLDGSIYLKRDGVVEEVFLKGPLYRVGSRLNSATLARMEMKAGRYTLALAGEAGPGTPGGFGYLTLDVAGNGTVTGSGALADGTRITSLQAKANDVEGGLAIPLSWTSGTISLSGLLVLGGTGGNLVWRDSRAQFGADGLSAREVKLSVLGGKYDYWTALDRLYSGWALTVNDPESPFSELELLATKSGFVDPSSKVICSLNRETGVLTGSRNGVSFEAILLNDALAQGEVGAAGVALGSAGERSDFSLQLNWMDPDWKEGGDISVMISFDPNGAVGEISPIFGLLGSTVVLPDCPLTPSGLKFIGWLHPATGTVYQPGDEIRVPAEDVVMVAQWEDVRLKNALKTSLNVAGDSRWVVDTAKAGATGGVCLKTAASALQEVIVLEATVSGPGKVTFRWALDRLEGVMGLTGDDKFEFFVDPAAGSASAKALTASSDWANATVSVTGEGPHVLQWKFTSSSMFAQGTGWMDLISWTPDVPKVTLTFNANGGTCSETSRKVDANGTVTSLPVPTKKDCEFLGWYDGNVKKTAPFTVGKSDLTLTARWTPAPVQVTFAAGPVGGTPPAAIKVVPGESCTLPGIGKLGKTGYGFIGWWDGQSLYDIGAIYPVTAATTFTATWTNAALNKVFGCDNIALYSHDESLWTQGTFFIANNVSAGYAVGTVADLNGIVQMDGKLAFTWVFSQAVDTSLGTLDDKFEFLIDGQLVQNLAPTPTGSRQAFSVKKGQTLTWRFTEHSRRKSLKSNALVYLGLATLVPDVPQITLTFDANGGTCAEKSRKVNENGTVASLPVPTWAGHDFDGWYDGEKKVIAPFAVGTKDLTLVAHWLLSPVQVSFKAGPVDGTPPSPLPVRPGESCTLPGTGELGKAGYGFVGWWNGQSLYDVGEAYPVTTAMTFTATWTNVQFTTWLKATGIGFYSQDEAAWGNVGYLKVVGARTTAAGSIAELNGIAEYDGTVQFTWMMLGTVNDTFEFFVDGVRQTALTTATGATRTPSYSVKKGQTMTWRYTCGSDVRTGKTIGLADVVLTRSGYDVTVSWAEKTGVVGARYSIQDGVQDAAAVNGGKITVPSGKTVTVVGLADTNNWYVITGGEGVFSQATATTLTAAKRDPGNLPPDVKPADVGFSTESGAPFATASSAEIAKAMAWAQTNGKTVSDMNALRFSAGDSGAPLNQVSEAYLLNCAPTDAAVAEAKAGFRFESFDPANPPTAETFAGMGYNGRVLILTTKSLADPQWSESSATSGESLFYKAELVK